MVPGAEPRYMRVSLQHNASQRAHMLGYGSKAGARGGNRTRMTVRSADFKSDASTNFATRAGIAGPLYRARTMIRAANEKRPRWRAFSINTSVSTDDDGGLGRN